MKNFRDFMDMADSDLGIKLNDNIETLQNLRFQKTIQQLEDLSQIKKIKKEIAQIKTLIRIRILKKEDSKDNV